MSTAKPSSKTQSPRTGIFATLANLLGARGSGASPARRRSLRAALPLAALVLALTAAPASADFGLSNVEVAFTDAEGSPVTQAGAHPFAMTTSFDVNSKEEGGIQVVDGQIRDLVVDLPPGFAGDPYAVPSCTTVAFLEEKCPNATALGTLTVHAAGGIGVIAEETVPVYNLAPAPGTAQKQGFIIQQVPVILNATVNPDPPHNVIATLSNTSQVLEVFSSELTLWGVPADPSHDALRGSCLKKDGTSAGNCGAGVTAKPFITLPRSCGGPLQTAFAATSWWSGDPQNPGPPASFSTVAEGEALGGCASLAFAPSITAQPTARAATSPTGLDFSLDVKDEGLGSPTGIAGSDIEAVEVTLPEGMSVNPSQAEGLAVCSEADVARESAFSQAGQGCPDAAKIGSIEVETPLLEGKLLKGALYVAKPYENPFGSLIAFYIVIKNPELGISVVQPARVSADPDSGRLITTTEEMPQLPFSHFRLHFKEGARSPIVTPPACGTYQVAARLYPYSGGLPLTSTSNFEIVSGPDNSPCPSGGLPPFHPQLSAGTLSNAAGRFSPFNVKITRTDSEQEITHFSIKLPPGLLGKLAGIPFCSDAAIAAATARTGPHGGSEELASPSCPAASQVGTSLAGAGVGPALAYAPGRVYLAGPYHGHPLSLVAITSGVVGPFDIGTVVVRLAIDVNPETGEVFLDSTGSDPIPHIIKGIPVHLRDIRAYTDRPEFIFNPTSCEASSTAATVLGSGLDFVSALDDNPFVSTSRFQAADCAALPFRPKLTVQLKGSTKRAGNPALHAHLSMAGMGALGANEAGLAYSRVALPKSLFLDNAHINTICTRVQFREGAVEGEKCPAGSVIGSAKAVTPILSEPLTGPIYLRSSEHQLPDIAAALHGQEISVVAVGHTDSAKGGGLRNTFDVVPDAPITSVDIDLFGGKKGLIISSRNLCSYKPKAKVEFKGHNGKQANYPKLAIKATGCKKHKRKHLRHHRSSR